MVVGIEAGPATMIGVLLPPLYHAFRRHPAAGSMNNAAARAKGPCGGAEMCILAPWPWGRSRGAIWRGRRGLGSRALAGRNGGAAALHGRVHAEEGPPARTASVCVAASLAAAGDGVERWGGPARRCLPRSRSQGGRWGGKGGRTAKHVAAAAAALCCSASMQH